MDFSNYNLAELAVSPRGVYGLADGLLLEIAAAFGYNLNVTPSVETLSELIAAVGPHKTLQDNIQHVMDTLGDDAVQITADWMDRSGCMKATSGAFSNAESDLPALVDAVVWTGGVANWMLRRLNLTLRLNPETVDGVMLAMGNRLMGDTEHQLVATFARHEGRQPTEYQFGVAFVVPVLSAAGFNVQPYRVESGSGDEVCESVFREYRSLLKGTMLTVGNAPNLIQGAGQLRAAARRVDPTFDADGNQLFMIGDFFPVARAGEHKDTHQNPLSGIGQIARNAKFLQEAIEAT